MTFPAGTTGGGCLSTSLGRFRVEVLSLHSWLGWELLNSGRKALVLLGFMCGCVMPPLQSPSWLPLSQRNWASSTGVETVAFPSETALSPLR